ADDYDDERAEAGQADDYENGRADAEGDHEDDDPDALDDEHAATVSDDDAEEHGGNESAADADDRANGPAVAAEHRGEAPTAGEERVQERHNESGQERSVNAIQRGPPVDMPDQVPDFVSEVHGGIGDVLSGDFTGDLAAAISDLTPSDEAEENESSTGSTESATGGNESATGANESATGLNESATGATESATAGDLPEPATDAVGAA
ncbi:MAG: hypothetical protein V5A18_01585, partial [Haloarculaceae archaeon]